MVAVEGIKVYYTAGIEVKDGHPNISITLKKLLFFRWLELAGARSIAVYN